MCWAFSVYRSRLNVKKYFPCAFFFHCIYKNFTLRNNKNTHRAADKSGFIALLIIAYKWCNFSGSTVIIYSVNLKRVTKSFGGVDSSGISYLQLRCGTYCVNYCVINKKNMKRYSGPFGKYTVLKLRCWQIRKRNTF